MKRKLKQTGIVLVCEPLWSVPDAESVHRTPQVCHPKGAPQMHELENKLAAPEGCAPLTCSALDAALALVDFGPCRGAERPQDWSNVAGPMCAYCKGAEDVNLAAARIIAAEYRNILKILKNPVAVHINMLRGTIAWTPEHLRHVIGDSSPNTPAQERDSIS